MTSRTYRAGLLAQLTSRCIVDDRGRRVQAVRMSRWWPPPGHVLPPEVRTLIKPQITPWKALRQYRFKALIMPAGVTLCNFVVLLPAYLGYITLMNSITSSAARAGAFPLGAVLLMVGWLVLVVAISSLIATPFGRWYWNPLIVPAVLGAGHCPSCGYSLMDREPAEDGCRICPECGAAWRLVDSVAGSEPPRPTSDDSLRV